MEEKDLGFIRKVREASPLDISSTVVDESICSHLVFFYNAHGRTAVYERMIRCGVEPEAIVLNLHGGGFVKGLTTRDRVYAAALCMGADIEVWNADYSLVPEFPFPCALEDVYDMVARACEEAAGRNLPLILVGHSAGSCMIAQLAVMYHRKGESYPASAVILDYPPVRFDRSFTTMVEDPADERAMQFARDVDIFTRAMFPDGGSDDHMASVIYADDDEIRAFPKAFFTLGEKDILTPDALDFLHHLEKLGCDVKCTVYGNSGHSFTTNRKGEYEKAIADHVAFISSFCSGGGKSVDGGDEQVGEIF